MVSLEPFQGTLRSIDAHSSPRISFSAEFSDESNFISITAKSKDEKDTEKQKKGAMNAEFEFLSSNVSSNDNNTLLTADELFFEGKLLPFWQMQHSEKLQKISLKAKEGEEEEEEDDDDDDEEEEEEDEEVKKKEEETRVNWFVDEDPSPRPPTCTVLWKELLKLKKRRASSSVSVLSPSSSSSSSSSSSLSDMASKEEGRREKHVKRVKKGLERTRSASIRIRPMINMPICTQVKSNPLPSLFSLKKGR